MGGERASALQGTQALGQRHALPVPKPGLQDPFDFPSGGEAPGCLRSSPPRRSRLPAAPWLRIPGAGAKLVGTSGLGVGAKG